MRLQLFFTVTLALGAGLGACGQLTAPGGDMEFAVGKAEFGAISDRAVASTTEGSVVVDGYINTPDPCQDFRGESTNAAGELTITVIASSRAVACAQVIGVFPYRAVVRGLAAGSYRVRVLYQYENTGWPAKAVLDTAVTIR